MESKKMQRIYAEEFLITWIHDNDTSSLQIVAKCPQLLVSVSEASHLEQD